MNPQKGRALLFAVSLLAFTTLAGTVAALMGHTRVAVAIWIAGPLVPVAIIFFRPWTALLVPSERGDDTR